MVSIFCYAPSQEEGAFSSSAIQNDAHIIEIYSKYALFKSSIKHVF